MTESTRDVRIERERAVRLMETENLRYVWSGKPLSPANLDIDHCFPWTAWPCGDLWNLMPAHRTVNQRQKRGQLPSDPALRASQGLIMRWWESAYWQSVPAVIAERFALEAAASLPGVASTVTDLDDIFTAVSLQRMRLRHDQQVPEWDGGT